jgi:hypothetical protein
MCLLVSGCIGDWCGLVGSDEDRGKSRTLGAEDREWSSTDRVLDSRMIERLGDAVCGLNRAQGDEVHGYLGSASKPRPMVSPCLASKSVAMVLVVWPQNRSLRFPSLGLKTGSCSLVIRPTKSPWRFLCLRLKTKWEEVCRFAPQNWCADEDGVRTCVDIWWPTSSQSKSG